VSNKKSLVGSNVALTNQQNHPVAAFIRIVKSGKVKQNRKDKAVTNYVDRQRIEASKQSSVRASREGSATINNSKVKHRTQTRENNALH